MGGSHGKLREGAIALHSDTDRAMPSLRAVDFQRHLHHKADEIAPGDVRALVEQQDEIRRRIAVDAEGRPTFRQQVEMAIDLLVHHVADEIPHVPFRTVTLLTAALLYYLEPIDVIPDIVPGVGTVDDRLFMAFAFYEGADGIARYRAWLELRAEEATIEVQPRKESSKPRARRAAR